MTSWKPIPQFDTYEINELGDVRNTKHGNVLKPKLKNTGYLCYELYRDAKPHTVYQHRALASAFIENPEGHRFIDHRDNIRTNNQLSNLRWCSALQNAHNTKPKEGQGVKKMWSKQKEAYVYASRIRHKGKAYSLGVYDSEAEAKQVYIEKKNEFCGEFSPFKKI